MRMLMKVSFPVEAANAAVKKGTLGSTIQRLIDEQKPEAAYFLAEDNGERTGYFVLDMKDSSEIPGLVEPWFLAFNARVTLRPGTGSYTILGQIAAEMLGLPMDKIRVELGDSDLPEAPGSGGSFGANSAGAAVFDATLQ